MVGERWTAQAASKPRREAKVLFCEPSARVIREEWPAELIEVRDDGSVVGILHHSAL